MKPICTECGFPLTATERTYYGHRCEQCEQEWSDRISAWCAGGQDAELDKLYSVPPEPRH